MVYRFKRVSHAIWQYLNQNVTPHPEKDSVWKPSRVWYVYKIRLLEASWQKKA